MIHQSPTGILLAAGSAKRFGGNKLMCPVADDTPLAIAAAQNLRTVLPEVIAVVAKHDEQLARMLADAGCSVVAVSGVRQGTGASIAAGISASMNANGWVVALADMPAISVTTIRRIAAAIADGAEAAAPFYRGQRGHPVGFGRVLRDQLLALRGDSGGRTVLSRSGERLIHIDVEDPGILLDIDVPADLAALVGSKPRGSS